jgi:hypothetical protein
MHPSCGGFSLFLCCPPCCRVRSPVSASCGCQTPMPRLRRSDTDTSLARVRLLSLANEMREEAEAQPIPAVGLRSCRPSGDREDHLQAGVNTAGTSRMAVIRHDPGTCARILPLMWRDSSKTTKMALYSGPGRGIRAPRCEMLTSPRSLGLFGSRRRCLAALGQSRVMRAHASACPGDISAGVAAKAEIVVHAGIAHFRRNRCRRFSWRRNKQQQEDSGKFHRISQCQPAKVGPAASVHLAEVVHGDIPSSYRRTCPYPAKGHMPINRAAAQ